MKVTVQEIINILMFAEDDLVGISDSYDLVKSLKERIQAEGIAPPDSYVPALCVWKNGGECGYDTECGNYFVFNEGNCAENDAKFCQYCGGSIAEEFQIED